MRLLHFDVNHLVLLGILGLVWQWVHEFRVPVSERESSDGAFKIFEGQIVCRWNRWKQTILKIWAVFPGRKWGGNCAYSYLGIRPQQIFDLKDALSLFESCI